MDEQIGDIIKIPMRDGKKLVVCYNYWSDDFPAELCTYIEGEDGFISQDIAIIREHEKNDSVEVLVYADSEDEDYTNKFEVNIYHEEEL